MQYQTEREFQAAVEEYAEAKGWFVWHDYDPRRNKAGWPDLFLWRKGHIIFAELKREGGKPTEIQDTMAQRLMFSEIRCRNNGLSGDSVPIVRYFLWQPSDWDTIESVLD